MSQKLQHNNSNVDRRAAAAAAAAAVHDTIVTINVTGTLFIETRHQGQ